MSMKRHQEQWINTGKQISRVMVVADLLMWAVIGLVATAIAGSFLLGARAGYWWLLSGPSQ